MYGWCIDVYCVIANNIVSPISWNVSTIQSFIPSNRYDDDTKQTFPLRGQHGKTQKKETFSCNIIIVCGRQTHELTHSEQWKLHALNTFSSMMLVSAISLSQLFCSTTIVILSIYIRICIHFVFYMNALNSNGFALW